MKDLTFQKRVDPNRLSVELRAAIPELRPDASDGTHRSRLEIEIPDGRSVTLHVPDDVAESPIVTVVQAHDAADPKFAALQAATNFAEFKAALIALLQSRY